MAPQPAATATSAPAPGGLRPLTSRDAGADSAATAASDLPPGHPPVGSAPAVPGTAISGRVELAPTLAGRTGAALFVIARNSQTQQIVAVRKETARQFPFSFSLSGADAMTEGTSFEGPLDVTARLSQSGDAVPAKGDVEGVARGLKPGARDVRIVLDSVRQ
ncbi:MAG TPA: hypothetical protein VLA62_03305 [Solirubrobacterales bacterium]|nr:hypothetical protein [Solirubrobacterales bacterium]